MLGRDDIGELATGKQADLAMFTLEEARFSGSHDPLAALVLCGAHSASDVMVAGQWTVQGGQLLTADIQNIQQKHRKSAARLVTEL